MKVEYVVKVVIIVRLQYTLRFDAGASVVDRLESSGWLSTSIVTSFKASITEKNSTPQYSFQTSDRSSGTLLMVRAIIAQSYLYIHGIVRQPRECMKFGHRCLSEKATHCL